MCFRLLINRFVICFIILFSMLNTRAEVDLTFHVIAAQPFGYLADDGEPTGLHYELIQQLSIRSGIKIRPVIMPYNRIWTTMENGGHDGGVVWRSAERDALVHYLSYVWTDYLTVLTLKNKEVNDYSELQLDKKVGVMTSSSINDRFNNDNEIDKVMIPKYDNAVSMLSARRVDAIVGNIFAYIYIAKKQAVLEKLSLPGLYLGHREQWLQISKKSKVLKRLTKEKRNEVMDKLAITMKTMVADGTIRKLNEKYYGDVVNQVNDLLNIPRDQY